jgi:hypothetical protein
MDERTHWKLCDLASAEIESLAGEGIACTPDEILRIQWLAQQVETPAARTTLARGTPVHAGGAVLWPLTLAADTWLQDALAESCDTRERFQIIAFAMAHTRTQSALDGIAPRDACKHAGRWAKRLQCREEELAQAVAIVREQDDTGPQIEDPKKRQSQSTAGDIIAHLIASVGGTPDMWEQQVAIGYIRQQMNACVAQQSANAGIDATITNRVISTRNLGLAVEEIRQSRSVKNG